MSIGGREVAELTKQDIMHNMGFVAQSPFIFDGTIEENLLYACRARIGVAEGDAEGDAEGALPPLDDRIGVLQQTGIFTDVLRFGLNTVLAHDQDKRLVDRIIRVRENFQREFGETLADYVEFFDENRYLYFSSIAENLMFGTHDSKAFSAENLNQKGLFQGFFEPGRSNPSAVGLGGSPGPPDGGYYRKFGDG